VDHIKEWGVESLASPALGCGLGGLDWGAVSLIMGQLPPTKVGSL